jgi:hypothetical protein
MLRPAGGRSLRLEPTYGPEIRHRILYKILTNDGVNFAIENVRDSDGFVVNRAVSRLGDDWEGFLRHWRISRVAKPPTPLPSPVILSVEERTIRRFYNFLFPSGNVAIEKTFPVQEERAEFFERLAAMCAQGTQLVREGKSLDEINGLLRRKTGAT